MRAEERRSGGMLWEESAHAGNLLVQATAMDLHVHQMAGFDLDAARQKLAVPEGHEPVAAIDIGYLGDPSDLPEDLRTRDLTPRRRRPVGEFVHEGRWVTQPQTDSHS